MGYTLNAYGKPVFDDVYSFPGDSQANADFAHAFAWTRGGTASDRGALLPGQIRPGMLFTESDTGKILVALSGGGWRVVDTPDTGWFSLGPLNSGWTSTVAPMGRVKGGTMFYSGRLSSTGVSSGPFANLLPSFARPTLTHDFLAMTTVASLRNAYVAPTGYIDLGAGAVAGILLSAIPPHPVA